MSSLFGAINTAESAIRGQQTALRTVGHNIANGKYSTSISLSPMDAYGVYYNANDKLMETIITALVGDVWLRKVHYHKRKIGESKSCFVAGTLITMATGVLKAIEDVVLGDVLLGENNSHNVVLGYDRPMLGGRKLYSFNGKKAFVTAEHPFMTSNGWASISPEDLLAESAATYDILSPSCLGVGDDLVKIQGGEVIETIEEHEAEDQLLYNFTLTGDHTYYADEFLVHNKEETKKEKKES